MTQENSSLESYARKLRKAAVCVALGGLLPGITSAEVPRNAENDAEGFLPLPRWSEHELRTFRETLPATSSGVLLPENGGTVTDINELLRTPVTSGPRLDQVFNNQDAGLSPRLRAEDMRLFLPESVLSQPSQNQRERSQIPTPLSSVREVSPEFIASCEQALPKEYLIDPGMLVPEMQSHDMMRFLEFHTRDARIKLYVLIIGHDRKLPEGTDLGKIASGGLLRTDACLLVYPLGEPWRARLYVSKSVHDRTSAAFLSETVHACLQEALQASDVHDQLHRYAVHLSTRLFWLQRALGNAEGTVKDQLLAEVTPEAKTTVQNAPNALLTLAWSVVSMLLLGLIGVVGHRIHGRWRLRQQKRVWLLPEPETIPRLGGAFTGGGGGMIRYG